jgi:hypothetical protein
MLGKLAAVGTAMGVHPSIMEPVEKKLAQWTATWVQVGGPDITVPQPDGTVFAFEIRMTGDGPEPEWVQQMNFCLKQVEEGHKEIEVKREITLAS